MLIHLSALTLKTPPGQVGNNDDLRENFGKTLGPGIMWMSLLHEIPKHTTEQVHPLMATPLTKNEIYG